MILNPPAQPAKCAVVIESQLQIISHIPWDETLDTDHFTPSLYKINIEMEEQPTASLCSMDLSDRVNSFCGKFYRLIYRV